MGINGQRGQEISVVLNQQPKHCLVESHIADSVRSQNQTFEYNTTARVDVAVTSITPRSVAYQNGVLLTATITKTIRIDYKG